MFQAQNRKTINSTWKIAASLKIIMTTSVSRPSFTTQQPNMEDQDEVQDHSAQDQEGFFWSQTGRKTNGLRPHHLLLRITTNFFFFWSPNLEEPPRIVV